METASKPTTTLFVRLSPDLKAQVAREAQQRELSVNRWVVEVLSAAVGPGPFSPMGERVGRWHGARIGFLLTMRVCEIVTECCRAGYAEAGPIRGSADQHRLASEEHRELAEKILATLTSAVDDLQHELLDDALLGEQPDEDATPASGNNEHVD